MPSGLRRYQSTGQHHFVTFSCDQRRPYLETTESKKMFKEILEATRLLYRFRITGYVVMPEHVHLLVSEPESKPLSTALAVLKRSVSRRQSLQPFWLSRYYDFNVSSNEKLLEKLHYMHWNPVRRGLVRVPEEYIWSSYRAHALHKDGRVTIQRVW